MVTGSFDFLHAPPSDAPRHWAQACADLDPPDLAFGPEWRQPRPRPGERYFLIWDGGHILRGTKCGDGTIGLLFVSWPSDTTVRMGFGLWPLCRGLGIGWRVRDAIYDFCFSDAEVNKLESEVYGSNASSLAALHGAHARSLEEGRQRETIRVNGLFYDRILFGCTRRRWLAIRPGEMGSDIRPRPATVRSVRPNQP